MTAAIGTGVIRMGIELLFLTLDGVMFDTEDAHRRACNIAFKACGIDRRWDITEFRMAANRSAALAITNVQGISARDMKALICQKHDAFHHLVLDGAAGVKGECLSLAKEALAAGCKLAIVTELPARTVTALLEQAYGDTVNDVFSVVASGADLRHAIGNGPYQLAMRTVGVEAEHAAAIEASTSGLQAARAAGLWTFAASMQGMRDAQPNDPGRSRPHLREWRDMTDDDAPAQPRTPLALSFDMLCLLKQQHRQQPGLQPQRMPRPKLVLPGRRSA